jgi:hypothetical protein
MRPRCVRSIRTGGCSIALDASDRSEREAAPCALDASDRPEREAAPCALDASDRPIRSTHSPGSLMLSSTPPIASNADLRIAIGA